MPPRAAIIGDIHGCLAEARQMLTELRHRGLRRSDELILLGDLVDKGPDPAGVVRFFREERDAGQQTVLILGNHEEKHARWRAAVQRERDGGAPNGIGDGSGELAELTAQLDGDDVAFLDSAMLWHRLEWANALVVHAGVLPELLPSPDALPGLEPLATLPRKQRERIERVIRLRYWRPSAGSGGFVPMGGEQPGDRYWAELYDGRFGHVYFGHEPFAKAEDVVRFPHATALDLGVVHGNRLAAVVLEGRGVASVVVPAGRIYCEPREAPRPGE